MSESEEKMVVPHSWNLVKEETDPYLTSNSTSNVDNDDVDNESDEALIGKKVAYLYKDNRLYERCEYRANSAVCYLGQSPKKIRSVKLDFTINKALYCPLEDDGDLVDYLLLVGDDEICFYHLHNPNFETIKIPFKINNVISTSYGILIERGVLKGEEEINEPGASTCHIYSLSHPYSEVLPVLFKYRKESLATYAFTGEDIALSLGNDGLFLAYDNFNNSHIVCELRKCTPEEKKEAAKCLNSTMVGFDSSIFSWRNTPTHLHLPPMTSTPKYLGQNPLEITPLRRSIRNKAKAAANVDSTRLFQHDSSIANITPMRPMDISGGSSMFKSSMISFRSKFSTMNVAANFENLEINEIDVDLILVQIWSDTKVKSKSSLSFSRNVTATPKLTNRDVENIPEEEIDYETGINFGEPTEKKSKEEYSFDFSSFPTVEKHRLLRIVEKMIKNESLELVSRISPTSKKSKKMNIEMTGAEQSEIQNKINMEYAKVMKHKLRTGDKKAKKIYSMVRYRRELYRIWRIHCKAHAQKFKDKSSVKRLFVTRDIKDEDFIVLVYDDETVLMVRWNGSRNKVYKTSTTIHGYDALNVVGTKMLAILCKDKLVLYSGIKEMAIVNMCPIDLADHDLLCLKESLENTVSVIYQERKHFNVHTVVFDVSNLSTDYLIKPKNDEINFGSNNANNMKLTVFPTELEQKRWITLRWPTDIRLENVQQMLDSSRMILIPRVNLPENDDEKSILEKYDLFLMATYPKTVSKAFGRAVLNFSTVKASKVNFETVPKIEINGRTPHHNIHNFPSQEIIQTQNEWAEFYAAAAHVLSLTDFESDKVSFSWLKQWQEEATNSSVTAGCLFGYGLTGQFKSVNVYDIHKLLIESKRPMESIAILLGLGIAYRGTSHLQCYRTIVTHLPSFIEPTLIELKFEPIVHVASILALGFLFQGTTNSSLTNKLLNEMAKETFFDNDISHERYNYAFCAGVSIGLINLGRGVDIRDSEIPIRGGNNEFEDRLYCLLNGEKRILCTDFGRKNKDLCKVQRIGIASLNSINQANSNQCTGVDHSIIHSLGLTTEASSINLPFNDLNKTTANSALGILFKESSLTRELPFVNIHLTSPAACIALGLTYLRTGDDYIIKTLKVPDTLPLIEKIRPDVLMMRTLCGLMVDYDNITPKVSKLFEWMPNVIKKYIEIIRSNKCESYWYDQYVDFNTVVEAYFYIRAGISLALGIRYASTFSESAYGILKSFNDDLDPEKRKDNPLLKFIKESIVQNCSAVNGLAMALIMSGSGHLPTLQFLRKIKNYTEEEETLQDVDSTVFSLHTLANMGIGMLFMGNARYGFAKTNEAIAMLLLSVFPIFSHSISDNRCYFVPMRLLWSLATEYRHLTIIDVDSQTPIRMTATVKYKGNLGRKDFHLPDLLPPVEDMLFIKITAHNVDEINFDMRSPADVDRFKVIMRENHGRLTVKRQRRRFERVFDDEFASTRTKNTPSESAKLWKLPDELLETLV